MATSEFDIVEPVDGVYVIDENVSPRRLLATHLQRWGAYGWDGTQARHGSISFRNGEARKRYWGMAGESFQGIPFDVGAPIFATEPKTLYERFKLDNEDAWGDQPLLIFGETGTGKNQLASLLAALRGRPFLSVNLAAEAKEHLAANFRGTRPGAFTGAVRRPGYLERVDGGVLFLDELEAVPAEHQAMLLDLVKEKGGIVEFEPLGSGAGSDTEDSPSNRSSLQRGGKRRDPRRTATTCRLTSEFWLLLATNESPRVLVEEKRLRPDFYFRCADRIQLPPLRDRMAVTAKSGQPDYLERLVFFMLEVVCWESLSFGPTPYSVRPSGPALELIRRCRMPGNLRQLARIVKSHPALFSLSEDEISEDQRLRAEFERFQEQLRDEEPITTASARGDEHRAGYDIRWLVAKLLEQEGGDVRRIANRLEMDPRTVRKYLGPRGRWHSLRKDPT